MSTTADIGAARIRLIVDDATFDDVIEQGKNAVRGFGDTAQTAYDKTEKAQRKAANSLLDYVNSIGRADQSMDKFVRNASRAGVDKPVIDASISAWQKRNIEIEAAKELTQQVASAQTAAFQQNARVDAFIQQLHNLEQAAGKDYYALLQLKAAELGVSAQADPLIAKLKAANTTISNGTITAKQYAFAVRGLPAQFTDIFTSLAAGQNPLMVLLQQGGQIKDMFGGIGSAVKAVGVELLKLATSPLVLAAAAITTVAVAAFQAEQRITSLAIATAQGNGRAGSASQLASLAEQLNALEHINLSQADAAVSKLAAGGLLVGNNFKIAAEASARWATVTGQAVDDIAGKFENIAKDPLAAVLDGTVKLTQAQYDQVAALTLLGDKQAAVTVVTKAYADQINNQTQTVVGNLSEIGKAWDSLKDKTTSAWHTTGDFFNFLISAQAKAFNDKGLSNLIPGVGQMNFLDALQNLAPTGFEAAGQKAVAPVTGGGKSLATLTTDQVKANQALQQAWDQSGTEAEKSAAKIRMLKASLHDATDAALNAVGIFRDAQGGFSGAGWDRLIRNITDKQRQGPDPTQSIKAWEKAELDAFKAVEQANAYMYQDNALTAEQYYSKQREEAGKELAVQLDSIQKQIAALQGRRDSQEKIKALQAQEVDVTQKNATLIAQYNREEIVAVRARQAAWEDYSKTLMRASEDTATAFAQQARAIGMGSQDAQQQNQLDALVKRYQRASEDIDAAQSRGQIGSDTAQNQREEQLQAFLRDQDAIVQGYGNIKAAEADWSNGSKAAFANWRDDVENVAGQIQKITTDALNGLSDMLATFIQTGKLDFADFFQSLQKEILQFIVKQQLLNLLKLAGSSGGTFGAIAAGLFGSAHGNAFGGGALAGYRNTVVSQPTYFPFAKGGVPNIGVMGERAGGSSEAIMPLTRTSGGDLAVRAVQSENRQPTIINQNFVVQGKLDRLTRTQLQQENGRETQRALSRA